MLYTVAPKRQYLYSSVLTRVDFLGAGCLQNFFFLNFHGQSNQGSRGHEYSVLISYDGRLFTVFMPIIIGINLAAADPPYGGVGVYF